jgi:uncharacterized protein YoxC
MKPNITSTIVVEDPVMLALLSEKDALVQEGREISKKIDEVEQKISECVKEEQNITSNVEPAELIAQGNALRDAINEKIIELDALSEKIRQEKLKAIPKDLQDRHYALNDEKEKLEKERNKIALHVQKIKDKVIPKIQKHCKKALGEYEDLASAEIQEGKVVVEKFSHLAEWKRAYAEKNK